MAPRVIFSKHQYLIVVIQCVFLGLSPKLTGQNHKLIDSLYLKINSNIHDTFRIRHLNQIARQYSTNGKWEEVLEPTKKAYELSVQNNYLHGIAANAFLLAHAYGYFADYEQALAYNEISLKAYEKMNNYKGMINCLVAIRDAYGQKQDYRKQLNIAEEILDLASNHLDSSLYIWHYYRCSSPYYNLCRESIQKGDSIQANFFYSKCVSVTNDILSMLVSKNPYDYATFCEYHAAAIDPSNYCDHEDSLGKVSILNERIFPPPDTFFLKALNFFLSKNDSARAITTYWFLGVHYKKRAYEMKYLAIQLKPLKGSTKPCYIWILRIRVFKNLDSSMALPTFRKNWVAYTLA